MDSSSQMQASKNQNTGHTGKHLLLVIGYLLFTED